MNIVDWVGIVKHNGSFINRGAAKPLRTKFEAIDEFHANQGYQDRGTNTGDASIWVSKLEVPSLEVPRPGVPRLEVPRPGVPRPGVPKQGVPRPGVTRTVVPKPGDR